MPDITTKAGAYGTLTAGKGYFIGQTSLDQDAATEAALEADNLVDELFSEWDRTSWTEGHPTSISRAWLKVASGEYMDRIQGMNTNDATTRGGRLRRKGEEMMETIVDAGGPMVNGKRQTKASDDDSNDRTVRLWVT